MLIKRFLLEEMVIACPGDVGALGHVKIVALSCCILEHLSLFEYICKGIVGLCILSWFSWNFNVIVFFLRDLCELQWRSTFRKGRNSWTLVGSQVKMHDHSCLWKLERVRERESTNKFAIAKFQNPTRRLWTAWELGRHSARLLHATPFSLWNWTCCRFGRDQGYTMYLSLM